MHEVTQHTVQHVHFLKCCLQRVLHQANQRKVSVGLALLMFTMVVLSLPGAPHMASQGGIKAFALCPLPLVCVALRSPSVFRLRLSVTSVSSLLFFFHVVSSVTFL